MFPIPMVDLQSQYKKLKPELDIEMQKVLDTCYFVGGPEVKKFAKNLEAYLKVKHVIPCANGTDALQIALMALGLQPGDEVITTPFTFVATAEVIALLRLKPVFVDIDPHTFNIDVSKIEAVITNKSKCIIPVHLFGQSCDMESLMSLAKKHDLFIVEDNAQAIGGDYTYKNGAVQKTGTIGHIGCTSFFPSKNLGCYGDGGAIFTNDDKLAEEIRMICNHGSKVRYYHESIGVNSRLDALQAVVLNTKLKYLDSYGKARQDAANFYNEQLKNIEGITTPYIAEYTNHVFHQYTLILDSNRDEVKDALTNQKIASGVYYPVPLHLQEAYKGDGYKKGDFPIAEEMSKKVLSLPIHTELTEQIQSIITQTLIEAKTKISSAVL